CQATAGSSGTCVRDSETGRAARDPGDATAAAGNGATKGGDEQLRAGGVEDDGSASAAGSYRGFPGKLGCADAECRDFESADWRVWRSEWTEAKRQRQAWRQAGRGRDGFVRHAGRTGTGQWVGGREGAKGHGGERRFWQWRGDSGTRRRARQWARECADLRLWRTGGRAERASCAAR